MRLKQRHLLLSILTGFAILLAGCYSEGRYDQKSDQRVPGEYSQSGRYETGREVPAGGNTQEPTILSARYPWQTWPTGRDLRGTPLRDLNILRGDENVKRGAHASALTDYQQAWKGARIDPYTQEALVLRIASTQLALDDPKASLATLSTYFTSTGKAVESVDSRFSLVFAYAYGRIKDFDQSLAWFSRVNRVSRSDGSSSDAATTGARLLMRSIPDEQFYALTRTWADDAFVRSIAGQESKRRTSGGKLADIPHDHFWEDRGAEQRIIAQNGDQDSVTKVKVFLPLTGRYAALGTSTKHGVELALQGHGYGAAQVEYVDTFGDSNETAARMQQIVSSGEQVAVLGPLLSDTAMVASNIARAHQIPILVLSKKSSFETGGSVFRFGPTTLSQVESLLNESSVRLGLRRFASVYPDDASGQEAAQAFSDAVREMGLELVYQRPYQPGDSASFIGIGQELEAKGVQAIFFPDVILQATRFLSSLPPSVGSKIVMLGTAKWDEPAQLTQSRRALQGSVFVSPFFTESKSPLVTQFISTFKATYGSAPDFLAAQGFDAGTLVAAAMKRQAEERVPFAEAMRGLSQYDGLTGVISLNASGEFQRKFMVLQVVEQGVVPLAESADAKALAGPITALEDGSPGGPRPSRGEDGQTAPLYVMRGEHEREGSKKD